MILTSAQINQHFLLVSATTPGYGRVIMKKEELINKLGFQATQRAICRTSSQRKPHPCVDQSSNLLSCSSASSQPSSPQTWRNDTTGKHFPCSHDLTLLKSAKESRPSGSAAHRPIDLQSLFCFSVKTKKSPSSTRRPLTRPKTKATCTHGLVRYKGDPLYLARQFVHIAFTLGLVTITLQFITLNTCSHHQQPTLLLLLGRFEPTSGAASWRAQGCDLNQAFLILAPFPKTQLTEFNNKNRFTERTAPPYTTAKLDQQARNDYSPSSPLRSDWLKLMEQCHFLHTKQQHFPGRLESAKSQITLTWICFIHGIPCIITIFFCIRRAGVHCQFMFLLPYNIARQTQAKHICMNNQGMYLEYKKNKAPNRRGEKKKFTFILIIMLADAQAASTTLARVFFLFFFIYKKINVCYVYIYTYWGFQKNPPFQKLLIKFSNMYLIPPIYIKCNSSGLKNLPLFNHISFSHPRFNHIHSSLPLIMDEDNQALINRC
ncbi:hypothetical protein VP01_75g5 [Puccinia sorghi]|uniref:Uncharacterized protein n=1 Tax=Puccinia sorghi TaxID=27349 RepID=A0A0L6UBZ8_9BASI|nr:hypothetical protein VP01_75g5 [Puccinia sorghi]